MKTKLFILGCLTFALASCGSPEEKATSTATTPAPATETATAPAAADTTAKVEAPAPAAPPKDMPGEKLIAKSDCLGCHNKTQKIVGPAYVNIAGKYEATEDHINDLADKIIKGGQGVWGSVPMTPHPSLSKDDAKEMVKYILSLKK